MRIQVYEQGQKKVNLVLPTRLLFSKTMARLIGYGLSKQEDLQLPMTSNQLGLLLREIAHSHGLLQGEPIVEVSSKSGDYVLITL